MFKMLEAVVEAVVALKLEISRICCFNSLRFDLMSLDAAEGGELEVIVGEARSLPRPGLQKLRLVAVLVVEPAALEPEDDRLLEAKVAPGDEMGLKIGGVLPLRLAVGEGEDTLDGTYLEATGLRLGYGSIMNS